MFCMLLTLVFSCASLKTNKEYSVILEIETTSCYGTCPVYTMQIYSNGSAILLGKEHMRNIGKFSSNIEKERLNKLIKSFEASSFFEFNNAYNSKFKDLPTKYISYHKDGLTKKILAYDNIPKELQKLIVQLEALVKELNWEKIE